MKLEYKSGQKKVSMEVDKNKEITIDLDGNYLFFKSATEADEFLREMIHNLVTLNGLKKD